MGELRVKGRAERRQPQIPRERPPVFPVFLRSVHPFLIVAIALLTAWLSFPALHASTLPDGFVEYNVGTGWSEPVGVAFDPESPSRAYVWERGGTVWVVENGIKASAPLIDISEEVAAWRDHGLLGLALDPEFHQNGYIYLLYVVDRHHLFKYGTPDYSPAVSDLAAPTIGRVTRFQARASDDFHTIEPASRTVLIGESKSTGFPLLFESHGIGSLAFGADGTLLVSCGDGASYGAMDDGGGDGGSFSEQALAEGILRAKEDVGSFRAQLVDCLNGKVLRIDPRTGDGIASNPFYDPDQPRAPRSRVWALGLRNPFRLSVRPNTGSHNPADGNPGVIVLGDVGWDQREEIDVLDRPAQNCGWPLYEGLTPPRDYPDSPAENPDAPNPLGGFFKFKDLIVQDTLGTPSWPNPKNPSQQIPASVPRFVHHRPILDVGRNPSPPGPVRTGTFDGTTATETNIGAPGSPVDGSQFRGFSAIGGAFYNSTEFPPAYQNSFFFADFDQRVIMNIALDENNRPTAVRPFASDIFNPVFVGAHPTNGSLYYVNFIGSASDSVKQIVYAPVGNRPPVAAASVDTIAGASPFTVHFSSVGSSDPDGQALTYLWDFGDGTSSTEANPTKTFTSASTQRFDVTLTVTDAGQATAQAHVSVFVNHALPTVAIVTPVDGAKYSTTDNEVFSLIRSVSEVPGHPTTTTWQALLHHNSHEHSDPPVTADSTTTLLAPAYTPEATFYYRIIVTVTDDLGAQVQREVRLYPNAANVAPQVAWSVPSLNCAAGTPMAILDASATISDADSPQFDYGKLTIESSGGNGDVLGITSEGNGPGQVGVNGNTISYSELAVGTLSGGSDGQPLVVTFNSVPTPAIAQAILRRVGATFHLGGSRTISAVVEDGDGGTSSPAALTVNVTGVPNTPPTVTLAAPAANAMFAQHTPITLSATAADADGAIRRVEFFAGGAKLADATQAPFEFIWEEAAVGGYDLTAVATDDFGDTATSTPVHITVNPDTVLPGVWQGLDIGAVAASGSVGYADGVYTLQGSGIGTKALNDEFYYLSQPWTGDGEIIAHLASIGPASSKSFAGLMFREKQSRTSRFALLKVTASEGAVLQVRRGVGVPAVQSAVQSISAPRWLRLVRHGLRCTAYTSIDREQWKQLASLPVGMGKPLFVGLVCSSAVDGQMGTAVFDHVLVRGLTTPVNPTVTVTTPANGAAFTPPVTLAIDAPAADADGGIARVELFNSGRKVAIDTKAPFGFAWTVKQPGAYSLTARAIDFSGLQTFSAPVEIAVNASTTPLPEPWASRDIGPTTEGGTAVETSGVYTLTTAGPGFWGTYDQGRIIYRACTGNATIVARILALGDTAPSALAGVTIRESLVATARHATVAITAGNGASLQWRSQPSGRNGSSSAAAVIAPQWVKLVRRGSSFTASVSADGTAWTTLGSKTLPIAASYYIGFVAAAANPTDPTTAVVDQVAVTRP